MELTNKHSLPESIVRAIKNDTYTGPKADENRISVTTLINPPRIHFLRCRHWEEITEDVVDGIWKLVGNCVHHYLERFEGKESIAETRLEKVVNGITISGAFDLYESNLKEIHDYKTTGAYSVVYNPEGKPEWHKQLNIYAWLLESINFPVVGMKIIAILRDWSESSVKEGSKYPEIPISVIDIPKWPKEEVESYINGRVVLFKNCQLMQDDILPFCSDEEMWAKYKVMKEGRVTPIKTYSTQKEAVDNMPNDGKHHIESTRMRCDRYCQISKFCSQYQQYLKEKESK